MTSTKAKKKNPATARSKRVRNAKRARRMKKKAVQNTSVPTERNTKGAARDALPPKQVMPTSLPRLPKVHLPKMPNLSLPEMPSMPTMADGVKAARNVAKKGARLVRKAARKAKAKVGARRAKKAAKKRA